MLSMLGITSMLKYQSIGILDLDSLVLPPISYIFLSHLPDLLELSCSFNDPADVGNLISGSSAFCKASLNIWKFMVHILLKPGLENFEHYFTSVNLRSGGP